MQGLEVLAVTDKQECPSELHKVFFYKASPYNMVMNQVQQE
jgi:hypothetical protein